MTEKQKNLIVRTITGVLFVAIMVAGFLNASAMMLLFAIITGLTLWEYSGLVNDRVANVNINRFISTVGGVYLFIAVALWSLDVVRGFAVMMPYVLTIIYLLISELYAKNRDAVNNMAYTMLGQMYIAMPLALINVLAFHRDANGDFSGYDMLLPLSVFILLWANDTGAYCFGSLFGKHKLFPRISPGKTWEGSIGGGIFAVVIAGVIGYFANNGAEPHSLNEWQWLGLGAVIVIFGTWGDLVESLFKRTIGVKDSGKILPGHGGMMDRFDSSLLAIPAAVIYLYTITIFMQ
ncbi:phosphatidate cytidylyltransferase [Hallella multisaccharivorax DSM 17128]|uniref:Phosphatidate cytidylyltransferase n=1 Tax=Hallella multisaccharivorax DSM 17128 TaxID=688246 RepID=F8NBJ4_9BACT|nr:phosphatidate cytidylyltransferase [Hallella multisaccharivorax]EGN57956.1 phosphatidate cytidylyltransferase [Hallella multisaccharivorax DSM 17128]GJG30763.1 phosphatidate cytidylyltransferase [Hallella multisaccharivorax DSM 17128]